MPDALAGTVVPLDARYRVRALLLRWPPPPPVAFRPGAFRHPKGYVLLPSFSFRMALERFDLGAEVLAPEASPDAIGRALETVIRRCEWNFRGITRRAVRRAGNGEPCRPDARLSAS